MIVKRLIAIPAAVAALGAAAAGMASVALGVASAGQAGVQGQPDRGTYTQGAWGGSTAPMDDPDNLDDFGVPSLDQPPPQPPPYPPPPHPQPSTPSPPPRNDGNDGNDSD